MFMKKGTRGMQKIDQNPKTRGINIWILDHQNTPNPLNCSFTCDKKKKKSVATTERFPSQLLRPKFLSLFPVSLDKAFICRFYCFLFVSQYVIKAGLHSDTAVSLMSLPGPLTAAPYNISGLRRYPHSP